MGEPLTEALRVLTSLWFRALAPLLELWLSIRLWRFEARQRALRRRFGIAASTPIHSFDECRPFIEAARSRLGPRALEVQTSGSTRGAKQLVYTKGRVALGKLLFVDVFTRLMAAAGVRRMSVFVLAPGGGDKSLTSELIAETRLPSRVACAQAPYRVMGHAAFRAASEQWGETAARACLLIASNPGFLYATNPSTLAVFFERLQAQWSEVRALAAALGEGQVPRELRGLFTRVSTGGAATRLAQTAAAQSCPSLEVLLPGLEAWACWDGGYVRPFLDRARRFLPPERYRFLPMYSMSTETVETVGVAVGRGDVAFLPLVPGALVEFLPRAVADEAQALLEPRQLEPGREYSLVVSDAYGLKRYQTEDVFRCERMVRGLPDLRFVGRRGLTYSFTGEKVTDAHFQQAYSIVADALPGVLASGALCAFPVLGEGDAPPRYTVVLVRKDGAQAVHAPEAIAQATDAALRSLNPEYDAKRSTARLGPVWGQALDVDAFVARVAGPEAVATWQNQFKFLPLYPRLWS